MNFDDPEFGRGRVNNQNELIAKARRAREQREREKKREESTLFLQSRYRAKREIERAQGDVRDEFQSELKTASTQGTLLNRSFLTSQMRRLLYAWSNSGHASQNQSMFDTMAKLLVASSKTKDIQTNYFSLLLDEEGRSLWVHQAVSFLPKILARVKADL